MTMVKAGEVESGWSQRRIIAGGLVGNVMEWYDFAVSVVSFVTVLGIKDKAKIALD